MKTLKIVAITFGSIIFLAVVAVVAVFFLIRSSSGIASKVTPVVPSQQAVQAFDTKWTSFNSVVQNATPGTKVSLNVTQEELTSKVNEELKSAQAQLPPNLSIGNVSINLQDGKVLVSAPIKYYAIEGAAGMEVAVQTVNGTPAIVVDNIDMGKLPIPDAIKNQITGMIPNNGVISLGNLPVDVTGIQIVNGQLIMNGVTK